MGRKHVFFVTDIGDDVPYIMRLQQHIHFILIVLSSLFV